MATTIIELSVAIGIGMIILAMLTTASISLQRSFVAIEDFAKGQNDQMRISDFLALDMRRAFDIATSGSSTNPPFTVTLTIPNYYKSPNIGYEPFIQPAISWPWKNKRHHHHKHKNIILNQFTSYGPTTYNSSTGQYTSAGPTTKTVVYVFDQGSKTLTRAVNSDPNPPAIARDVADFTVDMNDIDETAITKITFKPRFNSIVSPDAVTATTYYQTTLTRNTR